MAILTDKKAGGYSNRAARREPQKVSITIAYASCNSLYYAFSGEASYIIATV